MTSAARRGAISAERRAQLVAASAKGLAGRIAATKRRHAEARAHAPKCGKPTTAGKPCRQPLVNGKCLTHDTMTAEDRAELCRMIAPLGGLTTPSGELSPLWKGDDATTHAGRQRAQRLYAVRPCEDCGAKPEGVTIHRHHKDGNTLNNRRDNIQFLCPPCHAKAHGGRFAWFNTSND